MRLIESFMRFFQRLLFRLLPFPVQVLWARRDPGYAALIKPRKRELAIDYFLGAYSLSIDTWNDAERIFLAGILNEPDNSIIGQFVKPGDFCVDIGSRTGATALAMYAAAGDTGRVDAFEPNPALFRKLSANLDINPTLKKNIFIHAAGLAAAEGKLVLQPDLKISGHKILNEIQSVRRGSLLEAPATSLDAFLKKANMQRLNFIRIAVDGFALEILKGMEQSLMGLRPILYIAVTRQLSNGGMPVEAFAAFLKHLSYELYFVAPENTELLPLDAPMEQKVRAAAWVALPINH